MPVRRVHWQATLAVLGMILALSGLAQLAKLREAEGQAVDLTSSPVPSATSTPSVTPTTRPSPAPTVGAVASPTPTASSQPTPVPPKLDLHVEAVVGQPEYINPILARRDVDHDLVSLLFNGLTKVDERLRVVPDLAQGWQVADDGRTYTFELRRDVVWHDGVPFTADDVVFTLRAIQEQYYQGPSQLANLWRSVQIEKVDKYDVRLTLREPFSPFLSYTTIGILPVHILDGTPAALLPRHSFNLMPVGTGPFRVSEMHLDEGYLVLEANTAYFNPPPRMERLEFQFYPNQASVFSAYAQGAVTGIGGLPLRGPGAVSDYPSLVLQNAPLSRETLIFLNMNHPTATFFADRRVREALLLALDRQQLIDQELDGQALVACSVVPPYTWAYDTELPCQDHNRQRATALLREAGWLAPEGVRASLPETPDQPSGDSLLAFSLLVDGSSAVQLRLAEELARQWGEIGVPVEVDPDLSQERLQAGQYMAALVECELPADPDPYPLWHSTQAGGHGQNYTGFSNREADELMEQGRQVTDLDQRTALYQRFQEIWANELPALPLYFSVYNYLLDREIGGVQLGLMLEPSDRFRNVTEWYLISSDEN